MLAFEVILFVSQGIRMSCNGFGAYVRLFDGDWKRR